MNEFVMAKRELLESVVRCVEHGTETMAEAISLADELRAVLAQEAGPVVERQEPVACATCNGSKIVDDGELTHSSGGIPYEMGPIKCVKDCPDCASPPALVVVPVEIHQQLIEMRQQFERANFVALGKLLNACLDKVKELNQ